MYQPDTLSGPLRPAISATARKFVRHVSFAPANGPHCFEPHVATNARRPLHGSTWHGARHGRASDPSPLENLGSI